MRWKSLENYPYKVVACELIKGLKFGFPLNYSGPRSPITSKNLKSVADMPELTKQKISKELAMGRIAEPFSVPPFPTLRVSPIGLVPKKNGDFRMIHNLSYPCNNSVNDFIDHEFCSVRYSSIDDAVKIIQRLGRGQNYQSVISKAPFTYSGYFLAISISWGLFFRINIILINVSLLEHRSVVLYLKNFQPLFIGSQKFVPVIQIFCIIWMIFLFGGDANTSRCHETLKTFQEVCKSWGVPLADDKTVEPVEVLTFLGVELDTIKMEMRLPQDKIIELTNRLKICLDAKKVSLRDLQSLLGLLNFACQVVAPGRAFSRRLINATCKVTKPHHRIRVSQEMREDLKVWLSFLSDYNGITVMLDNVWTSNETICLFTDSAGGRDKGFGIYFQGKWAQGCWPKEWADNGILADITFLELFPVVISVHIWGIHLKNK